MFKLISGLCSELYVWVCERLTLLMIALWMPKPTPVDLGCTQQRTIVPQVLYSPHVSLVGSQISKYKWLYAKGWVTMSTKDSSKEAGCIGTRYIMASRSPWVTQCAIASRSWKEDAFSQLFKKEERKLYSANKLLTVNYSLSSMAQSLLPQFSVLHMKHKISFLSSKPFLIEIGKMDEVRIGPHEVASFGKEYIISPFYFFQDLVLFLLNWKGDLPMTWRQGRMALQFLWHERISLDAYINSKKFTLGTCLVQRSQHTLLALLAAYLQ